MTILAPGEARRRPFHQSDLGRPRRLRRDVRIRFQPILDVARGVAAGYQVQWGRNGLDALPPAIDDPNGTVTADAVGSALAAFPSLPPNTFLSVPLPVELATTDHVRTALLTDGSLAGIVLDLIGPTVGPGSAELVDALRLYRRCGALIALGGHGEQQPELAGIVRLKPAMLRLGRDWVRDVDTSETKRSAIEVVGNLAGRLDAWILAEGVSTSSELRALAALGVPLAQGSFVGEAHDVWPAISTGARTALPGPTALDGRDGVLRDLMQPAFATTVAPAAAAVLPELDGLDLAVVVDGSARPLTLLERTGSDDWHAGDALAVNVDTPVADAVGRAMARPRSSRFSAIACVDDTGRLAGVLRLEALIAHLAGV
jgi:EAL domain-containing protein (putative c-di-GMP-specific phosphodiesterase class I)